MQMHRRPQNRMKINENSERDRETFKIPVFYVCISRSRPLKNENLIVHLARFSLIRAHRTHCIFNLEQQHVINQTLRK